MPDDRDSENASNVDMSAWDPVHLTPAGFLSAQVARAPAGECPYVLFLGAGASVSSNIPSVATLIKRWRLALFQNIMEDDNPQDSKVKTWLDADYEIWLAAAKKASGNRSEYATLFEYAEKSREQRQMFIEDLVERARPNLGYIYLAGLLASSRFNTILTTNFDDLAADALMHYYGRKAVVCAFDSAITSFNAATRRVKIVKLHGDYLFSNVRNVDSETLSLDRNMEAKLVDMCENSGLIVVGYSGRDESVMAPIRENLRNNRAFLSKGLHWCVTRDAGTSPAERNKVDGIENIIALRERYPDRVFLYDAPNFDELMLQMFMRCGLGLAAGITDPHSQSLALDFRRAVSDYKMRAVPSVEMRAHRRQAVASSRKDVSHIETDAMDIGSELDDVLEAQRAAQWPEVVRLAKSAMRNVATVLANAQLSPRSRRDVESYEISLLISSGKAEQAIAGRRTEKCMARLAAAGAKALAATRIAPSVDDDAEDGYLSSLYNGLCAYGLIYQLDTTDGDTVESVGTLRRRMKSSPRGADKFEKLIRDDDVAALVKDGLLHA